MSLSDFQSRHQSVLCNRERYLHALDSLEEKNWSNLYYFADKDNKPVNSFDPEGRVCPNGLAMMLLGFGNLDDDTSFSDRSAIVSKSLGYADDSSTFATIDRVNGKHSLSFMKEYIRVEAIAANPNFMVPDESDLRVIPPASTFLNPPNETNWYYCPNCGGWLLIVRKVEAISYTLVQRKMKGGRRLTDKSGDTRFAGGRVEKIWPGGNDSPDTAVETKTTWICKECGQELPPEYSDVLNALPFNFSRYVDFPK